MLTRDTPSLRLDLTTRGNIISLHPGKFEWNFRYLIFQKISVIDGWGISCELALRWMSLNLTDDKSKLVQVMAWCRQATSHYLSQCWPRSLSPYGVTRPQWVIRTLHDCPSQMNENLLISNSKLTSDSELIWWRWSTNLSSFVRDNHAGSVLYNGKDNHYQIRSWIQIMRNVKSP